MLIERHIAYAPRTRELSLRIAEIRGACIGCADCQGLCQALIELVSLPDAVLQRR